MKWIGAHRLGVENRNVRDWVAGLIAPLKLETMAKRITGRRFNHHRYRIEIKHVRNDRI
jgi:hypothetical protein